MKRTEGLPATESASQAWFYTSGFLGAWLHVVFLLCFFVTGDLQTIATLYPTGMKMYVSLMNTAPWVWEEKCYLCEGRVEGRSELVDLNLD